MKTLIALILICGFFLLTRLLFLSQIPASLYWDEASIGYNAYSISENLTDEWGDFLPVHFRAFGEFKLPVYIYSTAVFVKLFGLNEWTIRLPAVLYSLSVIILVFLISKKIFLKNGEKIGLLGSFILSVIPWFFLVSRTGFEATSGAAFFCLGFYLFLFSNKNFFIKMLTLFVFILSIYSYNSFRIITPFFLVWVFLTWFRESNKKNFLLVILLLGLFFISFYPAVKLNFTEETSRFKTASILSGQKNILSTFYRFSSNYLSHFSPDYLFISGDKNLRSHTGFYGMLYILDIIFILTAILGTIKTREKKLLLIFFVLFLSIIPAAIGKETPHSLRAILFAPFVSIITVYGITYIRNILEFKYFLPIVILLYLSFFSFYFLDFIRNYNFRSSFDWQYPYEVIFKDKSKEFKKYDKIFVSDELGQPYIFALYYLKYPPQDFLKTVEYNTPDKWGHSLVKSFDNFIFNLNQIDDKKNEKILIFAGPGGYKGDKKNIYDIKDLSGKIIFHEYE